MSYSLGVDLGAATCAAAARRGARIEPCALGETATTMPAVALPRADGSMLVGEPAEAACRFEPSLVARSIAARLGEADAPIVIDGQLVDPCALTEALIGTAIQRTAGPGEWPGHLVLTYPLRHGGNVEPVLERASSRVTTSAVMLVPEPIAAMAKLTHDVELALDTTVAVIDFGGTSFDVTLVRRTESGFDLVGEPASLGDFGGVDVDAAVLAHVEASIGDVTSQVRDDDHATMLALRRLRASCRAAKERLTSEHQAIVEVALPHARAQVQVTRDDLERAIGPALTTAVDLIAHTVNDAGLAIPDVHVALLVGGSSRIPLLTRLITERIGLTIVADPLPELTVSLGAALFGEEDPAPALPAAAFDSLGAPIVGALWPPPADLASPVTTSTEAAVPPPPGGPVPTEPPGGWDPDAIPLTLAGDNGAGWPGEDPWTGAPDHDGRPGWDKAPALAPGPWDESAQPPALWDAPAQGLSKERPWDQPWDGEDPTTYDPFFAPRAGTAAAGALAIGHEPDGAEEEFSRLTASDTDPFGTRSTAHGRLKNRPPDEEFDLGPDKDKRRDKGDGYGRSTDPRVVVGAIGAGLAIVLLGGFAVALGIGSGASGDGIAVGGTIVTTTSMVSQTAEPGTSTSAASTSESTTSESTRSTTRTTQRTTTTTRRTTPRTTVATQPQGPVPTDPPPTSPPTTDPPPTTTSTTTTSTTVPETTTTTVQPSP